jgi:DNA-binding MarR family transcriptional regulator
MEDELLAIQRLYPQIYHACHARHPRSRARNGFRVSERDQSLLAHLSPHEGQRASDLARHVGVGLPTLSEAVGRLERQGYVARERAGRAVLLKLTAQGAAALRGTSVLDDGRLRAALERLSPVERRAAVAGLERLAEACRAAAAEERR